MSSLDFGLKDIHVLITGASGGIGFETAKVFASLNAKVTAHYNSSPKDLSTISGLIPVQANVSNESDITRLFSEAESKQGCPVQVLIVNHGIWPTQDVEVADMTLDQWRNTHSVNLDGAFLLCRGFLSRLREYGGALPSGSTFLDSVSITFIGSTAGKFGEADHADYASSKAALMYGLTTTLKNEIVRIAPKGRVNSVNPGWVRTPMAEETIKDTKFVARALASTPLQKVALPRDVANQVAVLSSPVLSGHVTGVNVMVDGGMEGRCLYPPPN